MTPSPPWSSVAINISTENGWHSMRTFLAGHRVKMRLTQKEVARRMDCHPSYVSRLESGRIDPTIAMMARYTCALGLTSRFGLNGRDIPKASGE